MSKTSKFIVIALLLVGLFSVRAIAIAFFYDPLIVYFKGDYNNMPIPEINYMKYFAFLFFRYFLNSAISILIIRIFRSFVK